MLHALPLNGTWLAHWADGQRGWSKHAFKPGPIERTRYVEAQVPGEIHLDLLKAGLIDDPYTGLGHLTCRWVEEHLWSYRREFEVPAEAVSSAGAWIVLEGVEMFAKVYLNGVEVGGHANTFYPCRLNVTGKLLPGNNLLTVRLDPGPWGVADKESRGLYRAEDEPPHKRMWTRRIQSQTSWDWSPRVQNCGIQGGARLEWLAPTTVLRPDQFVPLATVSDDLQKGTVRLRLFVENVSDKPVKATLTGMLPDQKVTVKADVELKPGLHPVETTVSLDTPDLWWPVGHGAQPLYKAKVTLRVGDELVHSESKFVGFRKVRVVRDAPTDTAGGELYRFEINNRPIFCKGGNYVPSDLITARITPERHRALVDLALEANFNFLRIWGGGQYEHSAFFEYCDRKGVLVWQEFIFACNKYPVHDQAFFDDVMREARFNVRRLAQHPCLVAWCGNNELETMLWNWGTSEKGHVIPDHALYHYALPRMMGEEDPTRHYQPSSPYSFNPHINPHDHAHGDQHPWDIGFTDFDTRKFRTFVCRFANEGGVLGPTSLPTMLACLKGSDGKVRNFHWMQHDNAVDAWHEPSLLDTATEFHLGRKLTDMTVEQYTYWGGLLQSEGLRDYIDAFRSKTWNSSAAIFWMYNDVWPSTRSWTIVDHALRRTPSFHPVKKAFEPLYVTLETDGDHIIIKGVSELELPQTLELRFGLFSTTSSSYPLDERRTVVLAPNAAVEIARFPKSAWTDPTTQIAFAVLSKDGTVVTRNKLALPLLKELKYAKPDIRVSVSGSKVTFACPTFVLGVCLGLDGDEPTSDNFFDLYPDQPHTIDWTGPTPPKIMATGNL